jgi:predicted dehydrogenase
MISGRYMSKRVGVGVIGCGSVSIEYISNMKAFDILEVNSVTDINENKARQTATEHGLVAVTARDMFEDPEIQIIVNLTTPAAHTEISLQAIEAGKNIYNEKPLAATMEDAQRILQAAKKKCVLVGSAPDIFLGSSLQVTRKLIDEGLLGEPLAATAFLASHGPEIKHPNPQFYYQNGAGPLFDLGPYCLTSLVALFGPAKRVTGSAQTLIKERTIHTGPSKGSAFQSEVPTYISGVIDFWSGLVASVIFSFDIWAANQPSLEIYGTKGSLSLPGPHKFTSQVRLHRADAQEWSEIPLPDSRHDGRGLGVADMAYALTNGYQPRANGELAYHVLDILNSLKKASESGQHILIKSLCPRPDPLGKDFFN